MTKYKNLLMQANWFFKQANAESAFDNGSILGLTSESEDEFNKLMEFLKSETIKVCDKYDCAIDYYGFYDNKAYFRDEEMSEDDKFITFGLKLVGSHCMKAYKELLNAINKSYKIDSFKLEEDKPLIVDIHIDLLRMIPDDYDFKSVDKSDIDLFKQHREEKNKK